MVVQVGYLRVGQLTDVTLVSHVGVHANVVYLEERHLAKYLTAQATLDDLALSPAPYFCICKGTETICTKTT